MFPVLWKKRRKQTVLKLRKSGSSSTVRNPFEKMEPQHRPPRYTFILQCVQMWVWGREMPHIHPFLLPPVVAELVIQPAGGRRPLCSQPAYASLHEAQRFLPGAHLLQQSPNVRLENSLDNRSDKDHWRVQRFSDLVFLFLYVVQNLCTRTILRTGRYQDL